MNFVLYRVMRKINIVYLVHPKMGQKYLHIVIYYCLTSWSKDHYEIKISHRIFAYLAIIQKKK